MPQVILPLIPEGANELTELISVYREEETCSYFVGTIPVFRHPADDLRSFRMFTSQLYCQGQCKQVDIVRAFKVSEISVKRAVKKYREGGPAAFYQPRRGRGPTVITQKVKEHAERLLAAGWSRRDVAEHLEVKYDTLSKAIRQGRVTEVARASGSKGEASEKSDRDLEDARAGMGTACTRAVERVLAATGALSGAPTRFEPSRAVSFGGVLCALPALLGCGLLRHLSDCFDDLKGYYQRIHIFLLLAYMALGRLRCVERLRFESPGELGKLMGLDRVPQVRCLREKIATLSEEGEVAQWQALLSQQWMEEDPERAGVLYVDGHVRVYHGDKAQLPRRYVARQKLCLRGTTDYWVNDVWGRPFFLISKPVDDGLLRTLRRQIVPRLMEDVPDQPTEAQLEEDPHLFRFMLVFDRAGYSPGFFKEMWQEHRICCITYHKYPGEDWAPEEFTETRVGMGGGHEVKMNLAARGSLIGSGADALWALEVRKLTRSGHQISLISPGQAALEVEDCRWLFSRWSQENFFRYMMQEYAIDALSEYGTAEIPDTQRVVNPKRRQLDSACRSVRSKLQKREHRFGQLELEEDLDPETYEDWKQRKSDLREEIDQLQKQLAALKEERKGVPRHVTMGDLEEEEKFQQLAPTRKQLTDTIKMIAYRAETAMAMELREHLGKESDARRLLQDLYRSEADLFPDPDAGILHIRVHHMANPQANRAIGELLTELNHAEVVHPGTEMRLQYSFVNAPDPPK